MHFGCLKHVFWCVILNFVMLDRSRGVITERIFEIFIPELEGDGHSTRGREPVRCRDPTGLEVWLGPPFDCSSQINFQIVSISPTVTIQSNDQSICPSNKRSENPECTLFEN